MLRRVAWVWIAMFACACTEDSTTTDLGVSAPTDARVDGGVIDASEVDEDAGPDAAVADATSVDAGAADAGELSLDERLEQILAVQPEPVVPLTEPATVSDELYTLGQALFFDPLLSGNMDTACASCHHPSAATGDGLSLTLGTGASGVGPTRADGDRGPFLRRHAPELFNRGDASWRALFWDGRVFMAEDGSLRGPVALPTGLDGVLAAQALFPLLSRVEMRGMSGDLTVSGRANELAAIDDSDHEAVWEAIIDRLWAFTDYRTLFEMAYPALGTDRPTIVHVANAIAAFESVAFAATDTAWDDYLRGRRSALNDAQKLGAIIFYGPAECGRCHSGPLFTDQEFHNTLVPQIGPGSPQSAPYDYGRELVTTSTTHRFGFRTPPLRNVAMTAPYMHNGSLLDLTAMLSHYADPTMTVSRYDASRLHPDLQSTLQDDAAHVAELRATLSEDLNLEADGRTFIGLSNIRQFMNALTDDGFGDLGQTVPQSVPSGIPLP